MISKLLPLLFIVSCATQVKEVIEPMPPAVMPVTKKTKTIKKDIKGCKEQVHYFKLLSKLAKRNIKIFNELSTSELCRKRYSQTKKLLTNHQNKIGILYTSEDQIKDKAILKGIKEAQKGLKGNFIVSKVPLNKDKINNTLAKMVFDQKVGMLVTWGPDQMLEHVKKWQDGLKLPTLFINKKISKGPQSFKVYPNKANYAWEMLKELRKRNVKRIAILTPDHYKKSPFIQDMKKVFKAAKIKVVYDVSYNPQNYDTMDMACRHIFVIDRYKRRGEYLNIMNRERRKASAQGFKLNKKLVFLPAQVNFDAIFIPDNFKIVNHFVKLFQYYQVRRLPLFGTHEWRSADLVETNKYFLDGSFFVDFIGDSRKFNSERLSQTLDYKLMGYYSGLIGQKALRETKKSRQKVLKKLKKMKLTKRENVFRRNEFNWPTYSFEIQKNSFIQSEISPKKYSASKAKEPTNHRLVSQP